MKPDQYTPEEPISSIATALAPAALGIVRVSGKGCIELVSKVFSRPEALLKAAGNTLVYGWIIDKSPIDLIIDKSSSDLIRGSTQKIDEVMLAVYRVPKSFTGEDMVEIFCHGGVSVVTAIHNLLLKNGFRQANRGEYTFRAYINGKTDLTKAEAVREIIESHTDVSRSHAAGRLAGSLFEEIDSIKTLIINTLAAIEVEIEYPEDEETIADTFDRKDIETAIKRLQSLVDSWKGEKLYQDGARVVLAGKTNAGKSSLFNSMLKEERAIVSDIEGTTRDWLESWASINGIPVRLFDTAGLRQTEDKIEAQGVELSKNLANDADVVLYLVDSTLPLTPEDKDFIDNCREPLIVVMNKCDKDSLIKSENDKKKMLLRELRRQPPVCRISAKTGEGLSSLYDQITSILTRGIATERQQAGLGSQRQKEAVAEALECTKHALISADDNYTLDAVVQDLEDALDSLSEVTGDITPDDVLGTIFENFCVGK
ncbi:MAG: tRNA uridine-5-carboxymethylaminomethyl(34) synthesis GTPase MnmE [Treponema sp.]|nr:tRNA uridine-5-carboxymethylaminomethyl(34) synthesis GTPase MnmE [Treponema sp.]